MVINLSWFPLRRSPCRDIGGKVGTVVGIHQLGSSSNVLPLSWCCATWDKTTTLCRSCPITKVSGAYVHLLTVLFMTYLQRKLADFLSFWVISKWIIPMTLQRRRKLVVSPSPASRGLSLQDGGKGMRNPIGRWNLRRRGSMVTTGLKVAWLPSCRVSSSSGIGCAWDGNEGKA